MRTFLLLLLATCIHACDSDEVEYYCPETDFSGRNSLYDTLFNGTWKWHYSVLTCEEAGSHGSSTEIIRDTIRPDEYVPWLNGPYPKQTFIVNEGDGLKLVVDDDTTEYCILKWYSHNMVTSFGIRTSLGIDYRCLNSNALKYLSFVNNTWTGMGDSICSVEPAAHYHDICPSIYPGFFYPTMADYYIRVK